jgi:IS1 family transposase
MNKLSPAKRIQILAMLCEGVSMRSIARVVDVSPNTVDKMLIEAGNACAAIHDETIRNVTASRVQCDEIWSFTYAKQKNVATAIAPVEGAGDTWTWTALEAQSKLIISYFVGDRSASSAMVLMDDLQSRIVNRVQLTTDGHKAYLGAVEGAFGGDIDYGMLVKIYGPTVTAPGRYSPADCIGARKDTIEGRPDEKHISTSYVERQNLTMRMHMRRFTRLTNAFSKKLENHCHMVALYTVWYNLIRMHKTLRMSPAMAANVTNRLWGFEDILARMDSDAPKPALGARGPRGSYKKKLDLGN